MLQRLRESFTRFMQGRYGYDDYGRRLITYAIVLIIIEIVLDLVRSTGVLGSAGTAFVYIINVILTIIAIVFIIYWAFRFFSRNLAKRREENQRHLRRRRRGETRRKRAVDQRDYKYLTCKNCGQQMRVPRGKGKIVVKCPKCNEKTTIKS